MLERNLTIIYFAKCFLNYRYIGTKLDDINKHIEQIFKTEKYESKYTWTEALIITPYYVRNTKNWKHILWIAMYKLSYT